MSLLNRWSRLGQASMRSASAVNQAQSNRKTLVEVYHMLERYYANEQFSTLYTADGTAYSGNRSIYNPTNRVVGFYAGRVYSDAWSDDGKPLSDGSPSTVPFSDDVEDDVRLASMQALTWSNWNRRRYRYVRTGAIYGDVALKPHLDIERRKVYVQIIDPEYVTDIRFNETGDVIEYRIDIPTQDDDLQRTTYLHGERWTKESFTTYRDDREVSIDGMPATQANPLGFVPFVWVNHRDLGGVHGAPAIDTVIPKIDELNAIVTASHDYIDKLNKQPIGIASDSKWGRGANDVMVIDSDPDGTGRKRSGILKGPGDMRTFNLLQDLGLGPSLEYVRELISEIEKDLPETVVDEQLRSMQQVTGPGASRMMADVQNRLFEAEGNYDAGLIDACQMCISMGAFAARSGLWGPTSQMTEGQRLFLPFDLTSYDRGELAMDFLQRPLITETAMERTQLALTREQLKTATGLSESGYSDDEIYGEGNVPDPKPGILEDRQAQTQTAGSLFGGLINQGVV